MPCVVGQRTVQREHVGCREQLALVDLLDASRQCLGWFACQGYHLHAKGEGYLRHTLPDITESHDAKGLTGKFRQQGVRVAEVWVLAPASGPVLDGIVLRTVCHSQQMGEHHLCHTLRAIGWHVGHCDASFVCSLDVHHIIACCQHTDIAQFGQLFNLCPANHYLVGQHNLCVVSPCHRLTGTCAVVYRQSTHLLQRRPRQVTRIGCKAVKNHNLHNRDKDSHYF